MELVPAASVFLPVFLNDAGDCVLPPGFGCSVDDWNLSENLPAFSSRAVEALCSDLVLGEWSALAYLRNKAWLANLAWDFKLPRGRTTSAFKYSKCLFKSNVASIIIVAVCLLSCLRLLRVIVIFGG